MDQIANFFSNKCILVTGGTGSIGEVIVSSLLAYNPRRIIIFNKDDNKQYLMQQKYRQEPTLDYILGDIRDYMSVESAVRDVDIVFHAAALKQVPICEENPYEAIKTNVIGSQNIVEACKKNEVEKVVQVSTDKVVNTTNVMGATKFLSEKIFKAENFKCGNNKTKFCSVRFGNVLGSRGSVIPLFLNQAKKGLPIQITSLKMSRFFMSIPEAANLTLSAAYYCQGGETFILKMKALRLCKLVNAIKKYISTLGIEELKSEIIGIRPGEKLHEELIMPYEAQHLVEDDKLFVVLPSFRSSPYFHFIESNKLDNSSDQAEQIEEEEIISVLKEIDE